MLAIAVRAVFLAAILGLAGVPACADSIQTFSGYNSATASVLSTTGSGVSLGNIGLSKLATAEIKTGTGSGFAYAIPGINKSLLVVTSSGDGEAIAEDNVSFRVLNKNTMQIDPMGGVTIDITGGGNAAVGQVIWGLSVDHDFPGPTVSATFDANGVIIAAHMGGGFDTTSFAHATGIMSSATPHSPPGQSSSYTDSLTIKPILSPNVNLHTPLTVFADGRLDLDERVLSFGTGTAVLDPIVLPLDPNDIVVSDGFVNPNPDAPALTAAQIASLTADGVDLSAMEAVGLVGSTSVPEPRSTFLVAFICVAIVGLASRRKGSLK